MLNRLEYKGQKDKKGDWNQPPVEEETGEVTVGCKSNTCSYLKINTTLWDVKK